MADKDYHARLVVYDFETMSEKEKSRLVQWLYNAAEDLESAEPMAFAKRYTYRLMKRGK